MKVQEVMLKALSGEIHWFRAAEILGMSPRALRRWRVGFEKHGCDGLLDRRHRVPSPKRASVKEVELVLRLYRERYMGWNVAHFHERVCEQHGVTLSYSLVKRVLQEAKLVRKFRARGKHRRRREPRACFGEMLHLDGSPHAWLALRPQERHTLIAIVDDATSRLLYAQLWPSESLQAVMSGLRDVIREHGIPMALYTDRASWAFETPKAGAAVDKAHRTHFGETLFRLGVEHIPGYSPQARGRSERANRTLQGRLVNELRTEGIVDPVAANRYLREKFVSSYNAAFGRAPRDAESAFVPLGDVDLDALFCMEEETRTVGKDNIVSFLGAALQIAPQPGRRTCAGLNVTTRLHLSGEYSIHRGAQVLGRYDKSGRPMEAAAPVGNRKQTRFPTRTLDAGKRRRRPQLPQAPAAAKL